jgi:hypothetical protein
VQHLALSIQLGFGQLALGNVGAVITNPFSLVGLREIANQRPLLSSNSKPRRSLPFLREPALRACLASSASNL